MSKHKENIIFKILKNQKFHPDTPIFFIKFSIFDRWTCAAAQFQMVSHESLDVQGVLGWYMVRSTLLHLPPRGALRAILGGPLVTVFFRLQPKVFIIKTTSRNKSFNAARVSNHEKSDGDHHFLPSARHLLSRDHFWRHFGVITQIFFIIF